MLFWPCVHREREREKEPEREREGEKERIFLGMRNVLRAWIFIPQCNPTGIHIRMCKEFGRRLAGWKNPTGDIPLGGLIWREMRW